MVLLRAQPNFRHLRDYDLKSNIQVLRTRRASRKSESDSGAGGKKSKDFVAPGNTTKFSELQFVVFLSS
jgi:hypothetical protein